jgi:hypothetical protein
MAGTRLNDAERERIVDALRHHLGEERITLDEFESRAATVYAAVSREEAEATLDDLPAAHAPPSVGVGRTGKRHAEVAAAHPTWHRTDEVFRDPTTGRVMRVWVDGNRRRHYVAED